MPSNVRYPETHWTQDKFWSCRCGKHTYGVEFVADIPNSPPEQVATEESACDHCGEGPTTEVTTFRRLA